MKKSTIVTVIAILMVITVCLYFISGTYARYADSRSGNATTSVAKWAVSITDGTDPLMIFHITIYSKGKSECCSWQNSTINNSKSYN